VEETTASEGTTPKCDDPEEDWDDNKVYYVRSGLGFELELQKVIAQGFRRNRMNTFRSSHLCAPGQPTRRVDEKRDGQLKSVCSNRSRDSHSAVQSRIPLQHPDRRFLH
jgi:hypothetical protein